MTMVTWIILGLVSGFIASKLFGKEGTGFSLDIILGMVGALVAGFIYTKADVLGITMVNVYSLLVALTGSVVMLFTYHKVLKH